MADSSPSTREAPDGPQSCRTSPEEGFDEPVNCKCGGKTHVLETRRGASGESIRRRQCVVCELAFFTEERIVSEPKAIRQYGAQPPKKLAVAKAARVKKEPKPKPLPVAVPKREKTARERIEDAKDDRQGKENDTW